MNYQDNIFIPVEIPDKRRILQNSMKVLGADSTLSNKDVFSKMAPIRSAITRMADARNQPPIEQLFSMVWQSNELHLLFADTGVGKSILAVALSVALCKGVSLLDLLNETVKQIALYYDFELSDRQFRKRYSDEDGNEDPLHPNFYIDTLDFAGISDIAGGFNDKFNDVLFEKIRFDIENTKATVVVLDNLTYLNTQSTQDTKIALEVMRRLNELKKEYNLSILVLAHTPKRSDQSPLTLNDLAGSKHLSNFADSISAIGKSTQGSNIRYLKQIKPSRSGEMILDADNVLVCEIEKLNTFLTFKALGYGKESEHINQSSFDPKIPEKVYQVTDLLKDGLSYAEIAQQLDISKGTITKWKAKYSEAFEIAANLGGVSDVSDVSIVSKDRSMETMETIETETANQGSVSCVSTVSKERSMETMETMETGNDYLPF